jgi:hypothetical protein
MCGRLAIGAVISRPAFACHERRLVQMDTVVADVDTSRVVFAP